VPSDSFQTTRWSLVRRAASPDDAEARAALAALCEAYWYPIYAFIRRSGPGPHEAEDLTQGFFARLLERATLPTADPAKGRLRAFLLTCARNFLSDEHDRASAEKRGAALITSFDAADAEQRYASEAVDHLTPDRIFQRNWALAVLDQSLALLREEFTAQGKAELFAALRPFLGFGPEAGRRYEELAPALGIPIGTLKNHVFRLRQRWRELLFEQVAMTLEDPTPEEIKAELAELLGAV
jgi:RNA polymerase sigma-70 factor (ECF subfamily)